MKNYLIPSSSNLKYLLNLDIEHIFYFNHTIYTYELNKKLVEDTYKGDVKNIEKLFEDIKGIDIKIPLKDLDARFYLKLNNYAKSIEDCTDELLKIRMYKKDEEFNKIKKAAIKTLRLLDKISSKIDKDMTEQQIERMIISYGHRLAFDPIVASYRNAKYPHYKANKIKIKSAVLIDFGLEYKWYKADITDMIIFNNDKLEQLYNKLRSIFNYIVDRIRPGMDAAELDKIYRKAYKYYNMPLPPHSIGHGIGLDIHEYPIIANKSKHILKNVAITIEPGYYDDKLGLRYERDVLIYEDGIEILDI